MNQKNLLILSNGAHVEDLDLLKEKLGAKIDHIVINRDYTNITIPPITSGIFFAKDIDADDIGTISRKINSNLPMVRILPAIYSPVDIENVKTCEDIDNAINHLKGIFFNN